VGSGPRRSLAEGTRGFSHLLVAIEKFSKWIEVRPLTSIRSEQAVAFFTNIIRRFGVLNSIITDNDTQFTGKEFLDFYEDHHIRVDWAAVAHPMTNGQVERANDMILQGLKPRIYNDLNKFGKRWMKELPSVVWSLRTTPSRATGFSPFFLVYGVEAILPTDLEYGSPRTKAYDDRTWKTHWTSWKMLGTWPYYTRHGIAVSATLPRPKGPVPRLPGWRLGTSAVARRPRVPQAYSSLGRAVHHRQDFEARNIKWPTVKVRSTATLGTSNSYVASTLKMIQVVHIPHFFFTYINKV
jgi:transposase InsO family protein